MKRAKIDKQRGENYFFLYAISPLVHLKNLWGDWISANEMARGGDHSYPGRCSLFYFFCWLFKRNLGAWRQPLGTSLIITCSARERPANYSNVRMERRLGGDGGVTENE